MQIEYYQKLIKKRIAYIDFAKCIAIWLVLWGHVITQMMNHDLNGNPVFVFIYSFHMPLFMLVSGFFAQSSFQLPILKLVIKKFKQLIWPALTFGILWYGLDWGLGNRVPSLKNFIYLEAESYWFLKALFFAYIIAFTINKCSRWKIFITFLVCAFFCLIQLKGGTFFKMGAMLPFFFTGMWIKKQLPKIRQHKKGLLLIVLVIFSVSFSFFTLEDNSFATYFFRTLSLESIGNYLLCLITGLSGSMIIIILSLFIVERWGNNSTVRIGSEIGKYTLSIYLLQKLLVEILLPHFIKIEMNIWVYDLLLTPFVATVFLFICFGLAKLIYKNRYAKAILMGDF